MRQGQSGLHLTLLGYVMLVLVLTYPVAFHLERCLIGGTGDDLWIFQWNNWWVHKALSEGLDVYQTPYLFYPYGAPLYFHSFSWFNTFLWLLLEPLTGANAAYNLITLSGYILGGYTMCLLAFEVTGSLPASFLAGVVFAFFPYRMRHINHPHLNSTQWIPLAIFCLLRMLNTGRKRYGLYAGVAMALTALCGWQLLILLGLWVIIWVVYGLLSPDRQRFLKCWKGLVLSVLVCLLLVAPLSWPLAVNALSPQGENLRPDSTSKGTDLLAYLLPSVYHPLMQVETVERIYNSFFHLKGENMALGYTTLGISTWAVCKQKRKAAFWIICFFLFLLLALGPTLWINGHPFPQIPMPYRLVASTLLGQILRSAARLNILVSVSASVLVALGADALLKRPPVSWKRLLALGGIGAAVVLEYLVIPFPLVCPAQSEFVHQLESDKEQYAVADLPIDYFAHDKWYMYLQTFHGHPIIGGHVSRVPNGIYRFIGAVPLLQRARSSPPEKGTMDDISRQLEPLAEAGVKYILIHKGRAGPGEVQGWRSWFGIPPSYEDDHLIVYRTDLRYGRDYQFVHEIGEGIGVVSVTLSAQVLPPEGVLGVEVVWGTRTAPLRDVEARLALLTLNGEEIQDVLFKPCSGWPTSQWGQGAVARGYGMLRINPFVPRGIYSVTVGLVEPDGGVRIGVPAPVGVVEVQAPERSFSPPPMTHVSGVTFGDVLRLLGYDLEVKDEEIDLTLHWQALRRMDVAYKFFVHLYEAESGALVAQADVMPRNWTYPTDWWEAGEVVSDEIPLSLEGVSPGDYWLAVGVYEPETGSRLLATDASGKPLPENRVLLEVVRVLLP